MPGEREQRKHQGKSPLSLSLSRQGRGNEEDAGGRGNKEGAGGIAPDFPLSLEEDLSCSPPPP